MSHVETTKDKVSFASAHKEAKSPFEIAQDVYVVDNVGELQFMTFSLHATRKLKRKKSLNKFGFFRMLLLLLHNQIIFT